ncbi:MAG: DUF3089 domain-containing protein [Sphingomonas sp.]|nr:DUF3089 domain-containing protein [Sphingomonas sp.]
MCARRFLTIIFVLTLIFVAGAFAIYQWGGRVLINQSVPKGHFEAAKAGGGPDYAKDDAWLSRPGLNGPAEWTPAGVESGNAKPAAVFYIHPTTYLDTDRWNAPLVDGGETAFRTNLFVQSQASAFNGVGEIWAPRYRQAAFGAFLLKSEDAEKALDFAYRDVAAAFDEFVKESGDRPIILAGHSQGALHLERLLKEKVAGTPLAKRVVAAYVVGWPISKKSDLPALGLPACRAGDQSGCVLSWMTFGDPPNPDFILRDWEKTKGFDGGERLQDDVLCVNPISGSTDGAAAAADNPGTLIPTTDLRSATLQVGAVGAHCDKGLLILDGVPTAAGGFVLPGNNYHAYDYALFWGAIRRDVERRLTAWHR